MAKKKVVVEHPAHNLVDTLYEEVRTQEGEREKRGPQTSHYPSGLCALKKGADKKLIHSGRCRRQLYYGFTGAQKTNPPDAPSLLKMSMGDRFHEQYSDLLASALSRMGATNMQREVVVKWKDESLDHEFSGRLDMVYELNGKTYGVDWKSKFGYGMNAVKNGNIDEGTIFQMLSYLVQPVIKLDGIDLLFIDRGSAYLYGFFFTQHRGVASVFIHNQQAWGTIEYEWKHIVAGLMSLEQSLASKELPARDFTILKAKPDWQCDYCSYKDLCWKDQKVVGF